MALVMLPCDLPWWSSIQKKLTTLQQSTDLDEQLDIMQKIHDLCNVSLDPDDDKRIENVYKGLKDYVESNMSDDEKTHFINVTLKNIAKRALSLKSHRPPRGLEFSLQQQSDSVQITYSLLAALLANAFFSTFPKRTEKTHPTLQDFNFTNYFTGTVEQHTQQAKLKCLLKYFDWIELDNNLDGFMNISRQVMTGKQWLTIEDWLECRLPLCSIDIRHEGRIERSKSDYIQSVFVSPKLGGNVLSNGDSQECFHFSILPELLPILLYAEALEDNETILVENARQISRIFIPQTNKTITEHLDEPKKISLLLMDAEDYSYCPINQFEEDNVLRELNKCLLAFRQKTSCSILENRQKRTKETSISRKFGSQLSPIEETGTNGSNAGDVSTTIVIRQASTSTKRSSYDSEHLRDDISGRRAWLSPVGISPLCTTTGATNIATNTAGTFVTSNCGKGGGGVGGVSGGVGGDSSNNECSMRHDKEGSVGPLTVNGRRGRFIVLGSSGECLPVNRRSMLFNSNDSSSLYSSCESGSDEFLSAKDSFDSEDSGKENFSKKYVNDLETLEKRCTFAEKLRAALRQSDQTYSASTEDSSYAVDISISGSKPEDDGIRIRRGGSRGFVLTEDSMDDEFLKQSMVRDEKFIEDCAANKQNGTLHKNASSNYSFSTDYSSELDEMYDQFSRWLDDELADKQTGNNNRTDSSKEMDAIRDEAIINFANSLLKRTLSESFVGVQLADGCVSGGSGNEIGGGTLKRDESAAIDSNMNTKKILNSRSLSLEIAKQKHRIAAQLLQLTQAHQNNSYRRGKENVGAVATGNWGCGKSLCGDVQLKFVIQWMAASVAGLPVLLYYTAGHEKLSKLDTVCRVLHDRKWTVGELATATLAHAQDILDAPDNLKRRNECFFEKLIGYY